MSIGKWRPLPYYKLQYVYSNKRYQISHRKSHHGARRCQSQDSFSARKARSKVDLRHVVFSGHGGDDGRLQCVSPKAPMTSDRITVVVRRSGNTTAAALSSTSGSGRPFACKLAQLSRQDLPRFGSGKHKIVRSRFLSDISSAISHSVASVNSTISTRMSELPILEASFFFHSRLSR
jgi:hypothetical protein